MRATIVVFFLVIAMPLSAFAQVSSRASAPMFKGMELYSWRDSASGAWSFSLLDGTNSNKILSEIKNPKAVIPDVAQLKEHLASLAEGEYVVWSLRSSLLELSYPDQAVVDDLVKFAAEHKVNLLTDR